MGIERYSNASDIPPPPRVKGAELFRRMAALWRTARLLARRRYPHLVLKFRSVDEAWMARRQWEREQRQRTR